MMKSTGWIQAVTLVSLVIVGCNDTTGPGGDPISEQQAAELARLMAGSFADLAEEEVPISPSATSVPLPRARVKFLISPDYPDATIYDKEAWLLTQGDGNDV